VFICKEICKTQTDAFGFEQSSKEFSLYEFGEFANNFKKEYFNKPTHVSFKNSFFKTNSTQKFLVNPSLLQLVTSSEVENEFWKILSSEHTSVSVMYGADLHTLEVGSGFPCSKRDANLKEYQVE
jgi:histone demethylase JARID1